jgi:hypothetical protein
MTHLLGVTHYARFTVLDGEGAYVEGATFDADQIRAPDGTAFAWSYRELGLGMYEVSWVLSLVGTYYLRLVTTDVPGTTFVPYEFEKITDEIEIGEEVRHYFTVLDDDGAYCDLATISVSLAADPSAQPFVPLVDVLGQGLYRVTYEPGFAGVYTLRLLADLSAVGDDPQQFQFEDRVVEAVSQPSPLLPLHGSSLDDLVRAVALLCRDLRMTTATEDSSNPRTWIARDLSAVSAKTIKGANLFIYAALLDDLVGVENYVTDSVDHGLLFADDLPSAPKRGDRGYLTNLESTGFLRQAYIQEINDQIQNSWPIHLVPAQWTFGQDELLEEQRAEALFRMGEPWVTPPREFTHIWDVSYPTPGYAPYETHIPLDDKDRAGWWWDRPNNRIVIGGGYRAAADGLPIQIRGYGAATRLTSDTDQTTVPRKWLTEMCAGALIWSLRDPRRQAEAQNHINRADAWLPELTTMVEPNTVRIR